METVLSREDSSTEECPSHPLPQSGAMRSSTDEAADVGTSGRRPDLLLQIPPNHFPLQSSSSKGSPSSSGGGGLFRGLSFKKKGSATDGEKSFLLSSDPKAVPVPGSPSVARLMSAFSWKRSSSVPVTPVSNSSIPIPMPASARMPGDGHKAHKVSNQAVASRSLSLPGRNMVIVRSASFASNKQSLGIDCADDQITTVSMDGDDEEIPEEEAVCRICLDICQEGNTLKMECSCKGALRLLHEDCAVKWFSTKGNRICDVCGQEVQNLPVTLVRIASAGQANAFREQNQQSLQSQRISAWQDFVVLVLISTICYFFFLEQLLIKDMKSQAVIVAAPFSFTLGMLSSTFAIVVAMKEYIWTYAALEFALVAIIVYVFYSWLHLGALYAVLLSSVLGFGIAMSLNLLYLFLRARQEQETQHGGFSGDDAA
ncbi:hypothetical protein MLD38_038872 [Melastoma candidum]|uniref:Uncharacterized protein n=1 Tax=Melastoma candidum TaxID=119954 RepID=A0ACB9L156_9MYRT|nr:hypothetical protein MLD38_038872 [Melastoma candidum]